MKPFLCFLLALMLITVQLNSQESVNISFFGSSVCKGTGAENNQGYAYQFYHRNIIDTTKFKYANASTGGDNTIKWEKFDRLTTKLFPSNPDIVVIGLSLGNEGIRRPIDDNGRAQIVEQYRSRLKYYADSLNSIGIKPVIVNCYAHTLFDNFHYYSTKHMNQIINTWEYPSINVLGTNDDLTGKWVDGYVNDPWHPNTIGHEEMSYAIVPSLFEAISQGLETPKYDWNKSYARIKNEQKESEAISFNVNETMHSFSLSFRFKEASDGSIGGFQSEGDLHELTIERFKIKYKNLSTIFHRHIKDWTHVVLTHNYAARKTLLFVNGEKIGEVEEQLAPTSIHFGGSSSKIDLKDIAIHRSSLNESEAMDLYNKRFIQSSLEFWNSLTLDYSDRAIDNRAQSLSKIRLNPKTSISQIKVEF